MPYPALYKEFENMLKNDDQTNEREEELTEDEAIERAIVQMDVLCRSRCVQSPARSNVTVREIEPEK